MIPTTVLSEPDNNIDFAVIAECTAPASILTLTLAFGVLCKLRLNK